MAQADRGLLAGSVADSGGVAMPAPAIVATHVDTRRTFRGTSGETGEFMVIEHAGFKSSVHSNVRVEAGTSARLDVKLEVGEVRQTVEIRESSAQLQTDNAKIQNTMSDRMIEASPTVIWDNMRSPFGLAGGRWQLYPVQHL